MLLPWIGVCDMCIEKKLHAMCYACMHAHEHGCKHACGTCFCLCPFLSFSWVALIDGNRWMDLGYKEDKLKRKKKGKKLGNKKEV